MPEEKVSSVKIPKNAGELANNWDKHEKVSDPQRGQWVQRCVTWSFPHQCCIQPLPPAAPVPQAAPRECDCEECASRLATAPDWAMRVAEQFIESRLVVPFLHGDEKHQEWLREETRKWIPDLAALIREAGSERERELLAALKRYGQHDEGEGCDIGTKAKTCTCGLDAAIKKAECS